MKPKDAAIQRRNDEEAFRLITEAMSNLSPHHYAQLRTWLLLQPTLADWKRLMKT